MDTTTILNFAAVTISLIALCLSLYNLYKDLVFKKTSTETEIFTMISLALQQLSESNTDTSVFEFDNSALANVHRENYQAALHGVVEAYSYACFTFQIKAVHKKYFLLTYKEEILQLFDDDKYARIIENEKFIYLHKFYQQNQ